MKNVTSPQKKETERRSIPSVTAVGRAVPPPLTKGRQMFVRRIFLDFRYCFEPVYGQQVTPYATGRSTQRRTCAQPVLLGLCPKLKYPPAIRGDHYLSRGAEKDVTCYYYTFSICYNFKFPYNFLKFFFMFTLMIKATFIFQIAHNIIQENSALVLLCRSGCILFIVLECVYK